MLGVGVAVAGGVVVMVVMFLGDLAGPAGDDPRSLIGNGDGIGAGDGEGDEEG